MEKPRAVSSGSKSVRALPSRTFPCRLDAPDTKASASTSVVLPLAPCPTTAILRMSSLLYSRIKVLAPREGDVADWGRSARGQPSFGKLLRFRGGRKGGNQPFDVRGLRTTQTAD